MLKIIVASVAAIGAMTAAYGQVHRYGPPPNPYDDKVVLPGKIPPGAKSAGGGWFYAYLLRDAPLESGEQDLFVSTALTLDEDGSYELEYQARWNIQRSKVPVQVASPLPIPMPPVPVPTSSGTADGINVRETGRFVLAGQILILDAVETRWEKVEYNRVKDKQVIANEKHVLIVRLEGKRFTVAGRCATWQIDPVCKTSPKIWYVMNTRPTKPPFVGL